VIALDLQALRQAGRVAAAVRRLAALRSIAGSAVLETCEAVEREIVRLGAFPAFPVQCSIDAIAAHSCPAPGSPALLRAGSLVKWDIGVHVDGNVVDTAVSVCVGRNGLKERLIETAQAALVAALTVVAPGVAVRQIARQVETTVRSRGFTPLRHLCGHGLARWQVHGPPAIPSVVADAPDDALAADSIVAIETFVTDGSSEVVEQGEAEVFRLTLAPGADQDGLLAALHAFHGLPFARRQLTAFSPDAVRQTLESLRQRGALAAYRPLVQAEWRPVAQAEHTVLLHASGSEVLTL
jgi:methionyl aminopeptidase